MNSYISIPREALAELLLAAGSPLTPEEYLASLPSLDMDAYKKYPARVKTSAWSKNILLVVAVLAGLGLPFSFDLEDVIIAIGLATVTYFEFRVHRYFSDSNPEAPSLGYRNQSCFAAAILIYGLYHAFVPTSIPSQVSDLIDPTMMTMIMGLERIFYLVIGIVGGVSQFWLACYYRNARVANS